MHLLVEMQHLTRKEFLRGLTGERPDDGTRPLTDEDARHRIEPMNCITWIIGHMAHQEHTFFVAWPKGAPVEPQYEPFAFGGPPSQPPLEEVMALWRAACEAANPLLHAADEESLRQPVIAPGSAGMRENMGMLIVRNIFHYWCHIGEISAIRQVLGHRPPQFVHLHRWTYGGGSPA